MGRLTRKHESGEFYIPRRYKDENGNNIVPSNQTAIDKLAHYEDLEEQGRLIEVVRCKECWRYDTGAGYDGWGLCELYDQDRKDNDYCSFGELKELEGDKE